MRQDTKSRITPPRFMLVRADPLRRLGVLVVTVLIGTVCVVAGYAIGRNAQMDSRVTNADLRAGLELTRGELNQVQTDKISAELAARVQRDATNMLRTVLTRREEEIRELTEEVAFYRNLMAPGSVQKGLQISGLEMQRTEGATYRFELLLTQVAEQRRFIDGQIEVEVVGRYPGVHDDVQQAGQTLTGEQDVVPVTVLSLTEIAEVSAYPLPFRFRYFQDLSGQMTLPEGFAPQSVRVMATQRGQEPQVRDFGWRIAVDGESG